MPTTATTQSCWRAALLDIRMQGKSGCDVAAYLRQYCHVPFMFLSAFFDEQTAAQVKALGAVAYLVKPLDIGQILPVVAAAFAQLRTRPAAAAPPAPERAAGQTMPAPEVLMGGRRADAPPFAGSCGRL